MKDSEHKITCEICFNKNTYLKKEIVTLKEIYHVSK